MAKKRRKKKNIANILNFFLIIGISLLIYQSKDSAALFLNNIQNNQIVSVTDIPPYSGKAYVILNNNKNNLINEYQNEPFEIYSELDYLGRCQMAVANLSLDTMPKEERTSIGSIKPTGWQTVKYDFVDGKYLYNRCHLIGFQLAGENLNPKNLITCTRSMNAKTMLYFENQVADYIKKTAHHVLYRVTPIFEGENLLSKGVIIEARSIEDDEIEFNVFIYNVEEGVKIDYQTGKSEVLK